LYFNVPRCPVFGAEHVQVIRYDKPAA
jgi:hypothetical protein